MSSDMEDSAQLTDPKDQHHHRHHYHHHHDRHYNHHHHHHQNHHHCRRQGITPMGEVGDDERSTDSGCSSDSIGSGECLSRPSSGERLCNRSPKTHCYLERLRRRSIRSSQRLSSSVERSSERIWKTSEDVRSLPHSGVSLSSYSSGPSDTHSSSDSDSLRKPSTTETLRKALQSFKITSSKRDKEKKNVKKSPKRILRNPVPYMYVRGLSGLPTQRVPRNPGLKQQTI